MRLRLIAPVLIVLALTAGGFALVRADAQRDANRDAGNRADIAATEVRGGIEHASNLVESLRRFMLGQATIGVTNAQFADLGARWLSPAGLPAAAWVRSLPKPSVAATSLRATLVTGSSPMTAPGIDLGDEAEVAAAVADPQTLFRVRATPLVRARDGRIGIFLVQSAPRLQGGVLEAGYVVLFVPASWLFTAVSGASQETNTRLMLRVGSTAYGGLGNAVGVERSFSTAGRRFDVLVPQKPIRGAAALLPWLVLGGGGVLAVLAAALAGIAERRGRAQREADRIFTLSADPITVAGFDGYWKRVNPAFERLLGHAEREARARPYLEFVHPDDRERSAAAAHRVLEGATTIVENRIVCKDGSYKWIEWTATPVLDEGLLYGLARDVTERRQTEREQAALRRVATLVARGAPPVDVFAAVAEEVGQLFDARRAFVTRYEAGNEAALVAGWSADGGDVPVGLRFEVSEGGVAWLVRETGRPARVDAYAPGPAAVTAGIMRIEASVAAPISVEGKLWGLVLVGSSADARLPVGTEARLAGFTELVATSIANAESREARARLADAQASLRRLATLVAQGERPAEMFSAVTEELSRVVDVPAVSIVRYEADGTATELANYFTRGKLFQVGVRMNIEGTNILRLVRDSAAAARIDDYSQTEGEMAEIVRAAGIRSTVGTPITVAGRLWGVMVGSTTDAEPLPEDAPARIADFTELLATAIENAESRDGLERLAEEQAALRRVATLVAEGVRPEEIFLAVSDEVGRLFGTDLAAVGRFDLDGGAIALVGRGQASERWALEDFLASAQVLRTGRSARTEAAGWASAVGPTAERLRSLGIVSTAASPIVVEGDLWGAMTIASVDAPLPPDTEERLKKFTELVATAVANAESRSELAASRRRIVAASDETRRRIERDLHDGAQQRLVSIALGLRDAGLDVPEGLQQLRRHLERAADDVDGVIDDLRELARGIHPAILLERGLGPALRTLARRSSLPVELDVGPDGRFPQPIEIGAYYVVSEALTNAAKHASATRVRVELKQANGSVLLTIDDDGVGGADATRGSGLIGLRDRVEALGGSISVESPPGSGTSLAVMLPLEASVERVGTPAA